MATRFWIYTCHGGFVRLSLQPGQTLNHRQAWETDEGWSSEANSWHHEGDCIINDCIFDGRDCDGRLTSAYSYMARIGELALRSVDDDSGRIVMVPDWTPLGGSQRDEYAEAMGY